MEAIIKEKQSDFIKKCQHGIESAYFFPFKCEECSYRYVKYCVENKLNFTQMQEYLVFLPSIEEKNNKKIEAEKRKEEKEKQVQEALEAEKKEATERKIKKEEEYNKLKSKYGTELAKYISERFLSNEELGKRYERFIGYKYEAMGYRVDFHGIKMGLDDGGIDLIAKAKSHTVIVQCKRRGQNSQIHENTVNQLVGTLSTYRKANPNVNVECVLYTQNDNLDESARKTVKLHSEELTHMVEPYPYDAGKEYPLVKCNIGINGEKIYHLPSDAMYDRIKIEYKKNELYVFTEQEAETLGFRRSKN